MDPDVEGSSLPKDQAADTQKELVPWPDAAGETSLLKWIFGGYGSLRTGWLAALFLSLTILFYVVVSTVVSLVLSVLHLKLGHLTPTESIVSETNAVAAVVGAAALMARIEHRKILDYNLRGRRRTRNFLFGLLGGFTTLSALVEVLHLGGWLNFGPVALSGIWIWAYGVLWAGVFMLTAFFEEGSMRCYLQFTLTRGINFWWALAASGAMCMTCVLFVHNEGAWGVYLMAALGLLPCLWLELKRVPSRGFWQAAWAISTFFGFIHTFNQGETWIGIFSAAAIGFVFCVSIWLTGSAWWAIGFHASWDWAQTFFYGTADSGFVPQGHYLSARASGPALWSGGTDGPEGSLLVLPTILVVLVGVVLAYRRGPTVETSSAAGRPQLF